jgi:AmiR/NasT family two-component response regulator
MRIAVADDDPEAREFFVKALARLGHDALAVSTGRRLVGLCRASSPDLVITDVMMTDTTGIEASVELSKHREVPVILITGREPAELLGQEVVDHIMAYLLKPVGEAQLRVAIPLAVRRFEQYLAVRDEAASLKQALEGRKVVERAKGALMRRLRVDEEDAYRRLRERASASNRKVVEAAREVLVAEETLRAFDGA